MHAAAPLVCALAVLLCVLPLSETAVPGTFFWKPRVGLDIDQPKPRSKPLSKPTWQNINRGLVVVVEGYQLGLTVAALAAHVGDVSAAFPHLHPGMAPYYTNVYRWALRHLSLLPGWFGGKGENYVSTHRVWKKRFHFTDYFVPSWMRKLLFFVKDESWANEEWEWKKFQKHAEPHFGKYYRYPSKKFNNFNSMRQNVTIENQDLTDNSITKGTG